MRKAIIRVLYIKFNNINLISCYVLFQVKLTKNKYPNEAKSEKVQ